MATRLLLLLALAALFGCSGASPRDAPSRGASVPADLAGTWRLVDVRDAAGQSTESADGSPVVRATFGPSDRVVMVGGQRAPYRIEGDQIVVDSDGMTFSLRDDTLQISDRTASFALHRDGPGDGLMGRFVAVPGQAGYNDVPDALEFTPDGYLSAEVGQDAGHFRLSGDRLTVKTASGSEETYGFRVAGDTLSLREARASGTDGTMVFHRIP